MVYNWDEYHDACYRLYIDEKKPLEEIMQIMRSEHGFAPSGCLSLAGPESLYPLTRSSPSNTTDMPTPFLWQQTCLPDSIPPLGFPLQAEPGSQNDRLVARIQELWAKNLSQKDMLRVLTEEDGFDIKHRELMRVRSRNRWLLRKSNPLLSADPMAAGHGDGEIKAQSSVPDLTLSDTEGVDEPMSDSTMYEDHVRPQSTASSQTTSPNLEAPAAARLNARKCRRRTRGGDNLSTDTPGPSRFPSETTIDESRAILNLDAGLYRELRLRFARICEVTGTVMWASQDNLDGKRLALDVICTDVTKRMRTAEQKMSIAEAKNILEINPEESRTIRQEYVAILKEDNFSNKAEAGKEHWGELKRKWMSTSAVLPRILAAPGYSDPMRQQKLDAVEVMASDILKRLRDDHHRAPHAAEERIRVTAATPPHMSPSDECLAEPDYAPIQQAHLGSTTPTTLTLTPDPTTPQSMHIDPDTSPIRTSDHLQSHGHRMVNAPQPVRNRTSGQPQPLAASPVPNHHHHMMPGAVLDHSLPIDPHIDTTSLPVLLDGPNIGAHTHHAQTPSFMAPHLPQAQAQSLAPSHNSFVASPFQTQPSPAPPVAVYLRLHPSSPMNIGPPIWISTLTTRTFAELRQIAVKEFAGAAVCERVEGILGEGMTIEISRDDELRAYLAVVEGRGGSGPRGRR
ncbi:hypothetical protein PG997_011953, partial [Apiospora hydei]